MELYEFTAGRIRQLCNEYCMTIGELSIQSGIPVSNIEAILDLRERDPDLQTIARICKAFGITLTTFVEPMDNFGKWLIPAESRKSTKKESAVSRFEELTNSIDSVIIMTGSSDPTGIVYHLLAILK